MMNWIDYDKLELAELTRQVIAAKRARKKEPEYKNIEEMIRMTGTVFCALEENSFRLYHTE